MAAVINNTMGGQEGNRKESRPAFRRTNNALNLTRQRLRLSCSMRSGQSGYLKVNLQTLGRLAG